MRERKGERSEDEINIDNKRQNERQIISRKEKGHIARERERGKGEDLFGEFG